MKTEAKGVTVEYTSMTEAKLSMVVDKEALADMPDLTKPVDVEIKPHRKKRTLRANAYMWVLCDAIAQKTRLNKEDVYRQAIRSAGKWEPAKVLRRALPKFSQTWEENGAGYLVEPLEEIDDPDAYITVMVMYGSSSYDSEEMGRLIDWIVDEAQSLGIDTATPAEKSLMMQEWRELYG